MRGISIKAIVLATLAVAGIDIVSGMVLMVVFGDPLVNATDEQLRAAILALNKNQGYLTAALILGTASTVVGGYVVARLVQSVPYFNALAFGVFGVALGIPLSAELPTWYRVAGLGLSIPAALVGAHLRKRQVRATAD